MRQSMLTAFYALLTLMVVIASSTISKAEPHADRCVILISVDGLAGFYLDDKKAHMPTIRKMAREGARAAGMISSFPTVTWPNHTTLVTGTTPAKHGVLGNNYLDRKTGTAIPLIPDPLLDKDQIVKTPTIYDVAYKAGLETAAIIWPATRNARTLNYTVPDMKGNESWQKYGTTAWLQELKNIGLPIDRYGPWVLDRSGGVQRDWLYVRMADQLLNVHAPNLLLIHLVEADHAQHRYGPRSGDAYWSVSFSDDRIRDIVDAVKRSPKADKTTIIVCSDHGFFPIEKDIKPNVLLKQAGLITVEGNNIKKKDAFCLSQGGGCAVYILNDSRKAEISKELVAKFKKLAGIQAVIEPKDYKSIGQPTPAEDSHGADLWLAAESGYSFSGSHSGDEIISKRSSRGGTHGFLPDQPDMLATFVIWGHGIKPGSKLGKIQSIDVAPTMAKLLGVELPTAEGKPLNKILKD